MNSEVPLQESRITALQYSLLAGRRAGFICVMVSDCICCGGLQHEAVPRMISNTDIDAGQGFIHAVSGQRAQFRLKLHGLLPSWSGLPMDIFRRLQAHAGTDAD